MPALRPALINKFDSKLGMQMAEESLRSGLQIDV